ncbi:MAG: tRNA (guanosine(46)-N7)-methyltransferase TrmB [Suipraeoptans sp.]
MRLRNIPRAKETLENSIIVIKNEADNKAKWATVFGNMNPIHVEIGMGKGKFITTLAKLNPDINYIGIEKYTSVLLRAVELMDEVKPEDRPLNLRFICMNAADLCTVFDNDEIDRIYLNFSDPWPKAKHARRRLTSKEFLAIYNNVLRKQGTIEFKTDNKDLFGFSLEEVQQTSNFQLIASTFDLHRDKDLNNGNIMTEYEEKFSAKGNPIHKLIAKREG